MNTVLIMKKIASRYSFAGKCSLRSSESNTTFYTLDQVNLAAMLENAGQDIFECFLYNFPKNYNELGQLTYLGPYEATTLISISN